MTRHILHESELVDSVPALRIFNERRRWILPSKKGNGAGLHTDVFMKGRITPYTEQGCWHERVGYGENTPSYQVVIDVRLPTISLVPVEQIETDQEQTALAKAEAVSSGCDMTLYNEGELSCLMRHLQESLRQSGRFHLPESELPLEGDMVLFRARHLDGSPALAYATACIRVTTDGGDIIGDPADRGRVWSIITAMWSPEALQG